MHALGLAAFQVACQRLRGHNAGQSQDGNGSAKTSDKHNTPISSITHTLYPGLLWFQDPSSARVGRW
jgi:hypothetical protein